MGAVYDAVRVGTDLSSLVRIFFAEEDGTPIPGLSVPFVVRDSLGAALLSGNCTEIGVAAPGWYRLPSFVVPAAGILTVEYNPPEGFDPDADLVRAVAVDVTDINLDVKFLRDFTAGNWKIENDQMVFFRDGQPTVELMRFNLYDRAGIPSDETVFERRRV